jgi:hypothetical protein
MEGSDSTRSTSDLGWNGGKASKVAFYSLVDGGSGAMHRKWRRRAGITSGSQGGEQCRHGALPGELEWGKREKGGDEVCSARRHASDGTDKERNERGSGTGMRAKIKSRQVCRGKRGVQCKGRGKCGAMPWPREHGTRGPRHRWHP